MCHYLACISELGGTLIAEMSKPMAKGMKREEKNFTMRVRYAAEIIIARNIYRIGIIKFPMESRGFQRKSAHRQMKAVVLDLHW